MHLLSKIGVIGEYDSICNFSTIGFSLFPVDTPEEALARIRRLERDGFALILITESFLESIVSQAESGTHSPFPIMLAIPGTGRRKTGYAQHRLSQMIEQAVGSDILSGQQPQQKAEEF